MEPSVAFDRALLFAMEHHRRQRRKASGTPYVGHLLGVAALVIDDGGSEDEAIAALLHDAVEDAAVPAIAAAAIRREFGAEVARIVAACTDSFEHPKRPWLERKRGFVVRLATSDARVRRVVAADKLHNARTLLADVRDRGDEAFAPFTGTRDETLWYYREVSRVLTAGGTSPLVAELARTVGELERRCG